ncbi:uncharacterized protein MONOS_15705 [Monocercomonoides exilis]|uniref:uncharacterized protein n=1 Tax=Monocercomonoides exilis TaxID=2049356 RepID=UPI00355A920F|nr:hypothetical protein MONOS_15705 [Monocercomonoides exilis]|eukprot:MONOS_15705.1-p1 / transcript=MONOS_15705.1 / gene=MONOS_15705 / organism=Monocercomonoides_exilis_PA203 / gene_product=unspecified product / transcript_product=unspecified product / location=Mono_scaffold01318:2114-9931(-) / protein_length=2605 / sequence_SO=supercontig / SO=protein_coding / is_pseudo=false
MILIFSFLVLGGVCSSEKAGFCTEDEALDKMDFKKGRITKMRLEHPLEKEGTKNKEWLCALGETGSRKQMEEDWKNDLSCLMSEVAGTWRAQNASNLLVGMVFKQLKTRSLFVIEKCSAVSICSSILVRDAISPISYENRESVLHFTNLTLEHESQNEAVQFICFADGKESSISMDNCLFNDLRFCGSGLICGVDSHSFSIKNTIIRNITREGKILQTDKPGAIGRKTEESRIENCLLISTENAFFGSVIFGLKGTVRFHCKNTSVIRNIDNNDGYASQSRIDTSDSVSLSNSEWIGCNSTTHGGAILIAGNTASTLTLSNCYFQGNIAQNGRGGAICATSISQISICNSVFLNCQAQGSSNEAGGAVCITRPQTTYIVRNNSFRNCFAGNDGGGMSIDRKASVLADDIISDCLFENCSTSNVSSPLGGGIQIWDLSLMPNVSNCQFIKNNAFLGGGGISISGCKNISIKVMFFCFFHENTGGTGGCDAVLEGQVFNLFDSSCYSTRQTGIRVGTNSVTVADHSEWLRNDGGRVRFVSSNETQPHAIDAFVCGINESYPCNTISHCLTQLIPEFVKDIKILTGTIIVTKNVDCGADGLSIYGQSNMSTAIQTELESAGLSLFSVSTGTLTVSDLSLVHDSIHPNNRDSRLFEISGAGEIHISRLNISAGSGYSVQTGFSTELINVQNGMLQMENVNWAKTISTISLFSLSSTNEISLTLSECAFDGIEITTSGAAVMSFSNDKANIDLNSCSFLGCGSTSSENGGSMMLCAGEANEVKVEGGTFDGCFCSSSNGIGGGILLRLLTETPDFLISSSFETNTAKWGSDVFVISPNLEEIAKSQKITCVTNSLDSFDKVLGYDNGNTTLAIPLCIYLLLIPTEIYVSNIEASDHSHCGITQFPCLTMKHSLTRFTGEKKVVVKGTISVCNEFVLFNKKHEIRGNDEQSGWTVSDASTTSNSALITVSVETELSKLIFSLPSSLPLHSNFISSSSSSLTLSQCSLSLQSPSSELACLFLSVESGTLSVDSFSASSITLSGNPLISLCGSGTNIELMNTLWLNMTKSNYTKIEREGGSGGCISIDNSNDENSNAEINIEECDFDGCSVLADESRGGAIDGQLKGSIQMNVISSTFIGCTAPDEEEKTGFGGGMALKLIDGNPSFVILSPIFDANKPNIAKYGNDLFIESSNLTKSITNTSLPFISDHFADISLNSLSGFDGNDSTNAIPLIYFWRTFGSEIVVSDDGKDVCICGLSDYPCLSIDYSLDRLPEGNERIISIIGNGILQKSVDVSGISVKSDESSMCSLECNSSLEGAEEAAMKIRGITNFELIKFVFPSSFTSGVNALLNVDSSEGSLTLKDCSFTKKGEDREEIINFGLIKANEGVVLLNFVSIQSLRFSHDVVSVLSTSTINIKNLTMKNVQLQGVSGLYIEKSSRRERNEAEQDVVIEWSVFEEVTQNTTDNIPVIRNDNDDEPLKIVIRNTTMRRCGGSKCEKGGAMFHALNEGGSFDCSFSTISECFCSIAGRGGWLFLGCAPTVEQPLQFVLSNITFRDNSALRGRDAYVRCHSIENQIVDEQFLLDFRAPFVKELAIWGCTTDTFLDEEDLLLKVVKYQSETIFVSSVADNHSDSKQCGEFSMPCKSLNDGVPHIIPSLFSQLLILGETGIVEKCDVHDVIVRSLESPSAALIYLNSTITNEGSLITTTGRIRIESVKFTFDQSFSYSGNSVILESSGELSLSFVDFSSVVEPESVEAVVLNSSLLSIENGILHVDNCSISFLSFNKPSFLLSGDHISLVNVKLEQFEASKNVFELGECKNVMFDRVSVDGANLSEGCILSINDITSETISLVSASFNNCTSNSQNASILSVYHSSFTHATLSNCSCESCISTADKGSILNIYDSENISLSSCSFSGVLANQQEFGNNIAADGICKWNGSLVHMENSNLQAKEIMIENSSKGGISIKGGKTFIEMGMLANNNPFIEKYPSLRRNIICSGGAALTISSLKGGDGVMPNSSLWILNDECTLDGIAGERESSFFIPKLDSVLVVGSEAYEYYIIRFKGTLLLPCGLSFRLTYTTGDEELIEKYDFNEDGFISEGEVEGVIHNSNLTTVFAETEVRVSILFGNPSFPSRTESFILKNRSESKQKIDEKSVESGKEEKSMWPIVVIVLIVILIAVFVGLVIFIVRWRKSKEETKKYKEILDDNINKDPKAFEMVSMEMSPENQWRRAEREAEKKIEGKTMKRVYGKKMVHSESSEHLLSEGGSTENILEHDSDKNAEWEMDDVDDEEEIQKRSPSPSISSTSTTDTSDTESTFVQGEDLCPTTSSMSNLVDAMACSSPHEKLIVDLRDSLFMLFHGRNEKKEMAIGSLQEREMTAAQILFWVANGALHPFEDEEDELPSLSNLSPHIVLFSEHMVICIALHSDCSSDSDSSSISSTSTIVTSSSDYLTINKNSRGSPPPSSAFEDDDDNLKECLRWKAPELQINKKKRATKESVAFSIGMMLWECLTLQIPFGEYEAGIAGDKITKGERPKLEVVQCSAFYSLVKNCVSQSPSARPSLFQLKKDFIAHFPPDAAVLTVTDAIGFENATDDTDGSDTLIDSEIISTQTEM